MYSVMTFRAYLCFMLFSTSIAIGAWIFILFSVNPQEAGIVEFALFYVTLFLAVVGLLALVGVLIRVLLLWRSAVISREVIRSFRHAILLSLVSVLSIVLLNQFVFHWWILVLLIAGASAIEYLFLRFSISARR